MHQPAPEIFPENVALQNDSQEKGFDQPEDIAAKENAEQAFNCPGNSLPGIKLTGIRPDFYRKPSDDPVNGS